MFFFQQFCKLIKFVYQSCQLYLESVHFVAASLYLTVFPVGVGGLTWIWLYQFPNSRIYFKPLLSRQISLL